MGLSFLSPEAGLLAFGVVMPLALLLDGEHRARLVRLALGLAEPPLRRRRLLVASLVAVAALLGLAATQPVLALKTETEERQDVEIYFVLDASRSMLASKSADAPTRFERARADALKIRRELGAVPCGLASLTDRLLPHLFPTADQAVFAAVLERSMDVDRPPPATFNVTATTLGALSALANRNFYTREVENRFAVVLTDAESRPFSSASIGRVFQREPPIRTFFVRYGSSDERVYTLDGGFERGYRGDPTAPEKMRDLVTATAGRGFGEGEADAVAAALKAQLGAGKTRVRERDEREVPLAPWAAALALLPLALVLWRRNV